MPGTYTPLDEWCDENSHRQFPLVDDAVARDLTGQFQLPQTFLVDALLCVPPGYDITKFFLMSVLVRLGSVDVRIGYDDGVLPFEVAYALNIPASAARNSTHYLQASPQSDEDKKVFTLVTGALVVGSMSQILQTPGEWEFEPEAAYFLSSRVTEGLAAVHSLQVGQSILTGNVILQEGSNVTISPSYDGLTATTTIRISATVDAGTSTVTITDDDTLIEALLERFGRPVTKIGTATPNSAGEVLLEGADCINVAYGTNSVSVDNPCGQPCCGKEELQAVYQVMADLNLRYARMESYYESLSRNVNTMQALLIGFEI
jgi:hypothetical protein